MKKLNHIYRKVNNRYKITKSPFCKKVYVFDGEKCVDSGTAKIFIYGKCKKNDYISTYYLHGIGFTTNMEGAAFARSLQTKTTEGIGEIEIEFLNNSERESNVSF